MAGRHSYDDVNTWLAHPGRSFGYTSPPTLEQMLSGEVKLVRRAEATHRLVDALGAKYNAMCVGIQIREGNIKGLRLWARMWLVDEESLRLFIADQAGLPEGCSVEEFYRVCGFGMVLGTDGYSSTTFLALANAGKIEVFRDPRIPRRKRVSRRSLTTLVEELLVESARQISAAEWIKVRLASSDPPVLLSRAAERLELSQSETRKLIAAGKLHAITSPQGRTVFVSPESIAAYLEQERPAG